MKQISILLLSFILYSCTQQPEGERLVSDISQLSAKYFIGHGVQWSAYPHADSKDAEWGDLMSDEKWAMNYARLDYMNPHIIRVMDQANWRYLKGFDKKGNAIISYDNDEVRSLFKLLDYCQKNNIIVILGEWGAPYQVHDTDSEFHGVITDARDERWLDMITEWLKFLIEEKAYTCIQHYNLVNEVNGSWASTDGDWDEWSEAVLALDQKIKAVGLGEKIAVMGPDAVPYLCNSAFDGAEWLIKSTEELDGIIDCYDVHNYPHPDEIKSAEFQKYYQPLVAAADKVEKPIILGELGSFKDIPENQARVKKDPYASKDSQMKVYDFIYGIEMTDGVIQAMNAGIDGVIAWALDDAMHTMGDLGNPNELKRWGFWNSLGEEICKDKSDEDIRPWFYPWSLMCREFPPTMKIVKVAPSSQEGLRYTIGYNDAKLSVALVNNSDTAKTVTLQFDNAFDKQDFNCYHYREGEYQTDTDGFPAISESKKYNFSKGSTIVMPANSFSLLTTK